MTGVDVAAIRERCEQLVTARTVPLIPRVSQAFDVLEHDVPALLDALAVAEQQRDDAYATIRAFIGSSDAWFGAWACGCSDTERTPVAIPEFCPTHGRALLSNNAGQTKVRLNHSGVSGYGIHPRPPSATPTAETVPPRVAGTGGPQNPAQSRGGAE